MFRCHGKTEILADCHSHMAEGTLSGVLVSVRGVGCDARNVRRELEQKFHLLLGQEAAGWDRWCRWQESRLHDYFVAKVCKPPSNEIVLFLKVDFG